MGTRLSSGIHSTDSIHGKRTTSTLKRC
jgi:hypothetical protein